MDDAAIHWQGVEKFLAQPREKCENVREAESQGKIKNIEKKKSLSVYKTAHRSDMILTHTLLHIRIKKES